jgi:glycosyltransferase involved in cell wall biosynthesis
MKKALIIAFYFPPLAGGGVQRPLKFVKYLPDFGWQPMVLTIKPECIKSYVRDESLLKEIDSSVAIHRTFYLDFTRLPLFRGAPARLFFEPFRNRMLIPSNEVSWNYWAFRRASAIIEQEKPSAVLTTSPPHSVQMLGLKIKRTFGLPWVIDLRDEWTTDPYLQDNWDGLPTHRQRIEMEMERNCFHNADRLIAISPLMRERIILLTQTDRDKIAIIHNGYDESDFAGYINEIPPKGDRFRILLMGNLSLQRVTEKMVRCVENLIDGGQIDPDRLVIDVLTQSDRKHITRYIRGGSMSVFRFHSYKSHAETIDFLSQHHVFMLLITGGARSVISGRLFEYLRGNRPIIGFIPGDGEAAAIIKSTATGRYCDPDDEGKMKSLFLDYYRQWESGRFDYKPNREVIDSYDREALTGKLSEVLNEST